MDLSLAKKMRDSNEKINCNKHFKILAGPGAGKTRFIVNHISNIISNSDKISGTRKIGCITYTNIGVETIVKRLQNVTEYIDVSTIHSFLYRHIVKPYLWVLKDQHELDYSEIDGHSEIIPTFSLLKEWKNNTDQQRIRDDKKLAKALTKLRWELDDCNEIQLCFKHIWEGKIDKYSIKKTSYIEYKKICWERGLISHDDVLFFSYKIIQEKPRVLEILRAKFPYILIDEFQDTSPIQTKIVSMIAQKETMIGVIGDQCQSIYSFQGADVGKFMDFNLNGMETYYIEDNYRSTQQIISVLNFIRGKDEFQQKSPNNKNGNKPTILVGKFFDAYNKAVEVCRCVPVHTLSYRNNLSNMIKYGFEDYFSDDIADEFIFDDGDRGKMIFYVINSLEYCKENKIKDAIKYMRKAYRKVTLFEDKAALKNIKRLLNEYHGFFEINIKDFYNNYLFGFYDVKSKITSGKANNYYEELTYKKVASVININDDNGYYRTIHKAKGDEFENVLLLMQPKENYDEEKELGFLLNPNMDNEEHRVYYVAMSRAMENIFVCVPQLSESNKQKLNGFNVMYL